MRILQWQGLTKILIARSTHLVNIRMAERSNAREVRLNEFHLLPRPMGPKAENFML